MKGVCIKTGKNAAGKQKGRQGKKESLFEHKATSVSEVSGEVVKADLMNHGYRVLRTIGEGAYAKVKLCDVLASKLARNEAMADVAGDEGGLQVAVKVINKRNVPKEFLRKFLPREIENHSKLAPHPHVCTVFDHFTTQDYVYMVMYYCPNGDLLDLINKHIGDNQKGVGEDVARKMFLQVCQALQHIHNAGIVHRDMKCENVLLDENYNAKLTDFGFSCVFDDQSQLLKTSCGSYAYTAPEVISSKPYDGFRSDIWSLGIILFAMVNGRLPFNDNQLMDMEEEMKMQRLRFERAVSFDCILLIRKLLQFNPSQRPTLTDIMNDSWITGKKPIPRQLNRPKWVNPYQSKQNVNEKGEEKPEQEVREKTPRKSEPVCYKTSPTKTTSTVTGTVTVNQQGGETVTLKSRGRTNIRYIGPNRPNTWPRQTKETTTTNVAHTPLPKKTTKEQTYTGPDIRRIAQLMVDKVTTYGNTPLVQQKEISKQVPLWLVQKILESETEKMDEKNNTTKPKNKEASEAGNPKNHGDAKPCQACPACSATCENSRISPTSRRSISPHKPAKSTKIGFPTRNNRQTAKKEQTVPKHSHPVRVYNNVDTKTRPGPSPSPTKHASISQHRHLATKTPGSSTKTSATSNASSTTSRATCFVKKVSPDAPKNPVVCKSADSKRVTRIQEPTPAERAKSCRERLLEMYGHRMFMRNGQIPLPPLYGQTCSFVEKSYNNAAKAYMQTLGTGYQKATKEVGHHGAKTQTNSNNTKSNLKHKIVVHCP